MTVKQLTTENLILRPPRLKDYQMLKKFHERNKGHLAPWDSTSNEIGSASASAIKEKLAAWKKESKEGRSARFFLYKKEEPEGDMIGIINFTQIFRGPFQACYLGYKIDSRYQGRGLMAEALRRAIRYVFEDLHLHRVMANYMPSNERSANLLKNLGFHIEGYAEDYLLINDKWEDHVLTSLNFEKWKVIHSIPAE